MHHTFQVWSLVLRLAWACVCSRGGRQGSLRWIQITDGSCFYIIEARYKNKYKSSILNSVRHKEMHGFGPGAVFLIPPPVCLSISLSACFYPLTPSTLCDPLPPPASCPPNLALEWLASSKAGPKLPNPSSPSSFCQSFGSFSCLLYFMCRTPKFQTWLRCCPGGLVLRVTCRDSVVVTDIMRGNERVGLWALFALSPVWKPQRAPLKPCVQARLNQTLDCILACELVDRRRSGLHSKPRASQLPVSLKLFLKPELILSVVYGLKIYIRCVSPYFFWGFLFLIKECLKIMCVLKFLPCHSFNYCIFHHTIIINMFVSSLFAVAENVCVCMGLLSCMQFYILWERQTDPPCEKLDAKHRQDIRYGQRWTCWYWHYPPKTTLTLVV